MTTKKISLKELEGKEEEIIAGVRDLPNDIDIDFSDIPPLTDPEQWKKATIFHIETVPVSFDLSKDISEWIEADSKRKEMVNNLVNSICHGLIDSL